MMGVERIIKLESDTGLARPPWGVLDFSAFAGGNGVECDWETKPESAVKPAVNVRIGG